MTRKLLDNYIFDASAKTITILDDDYITINKLLIIVNMADNITLFNFADTTKTATITNNIITLQYDTTLMSNADILQIWVEDSNPATIDFSTFFSTVRNLLTRFSFDSISRIRSIADVNINATQTLATVTTVTTANTSFGDSGKYATQQLISQNVVSNSFNNNITRS